MRSTPALRLVSLLLFLLNYYHPLKAQECGPNIELEQLVRDLGENDIYRLGQSFTAPCTGDFYELVLYAEWITPSPNPTTSITVGIISGEPTGATVDDILGNYQFDIPHPTHVGDNEQVLRLDTPVALEAGETYSFIVINEESLIWWMYAKEDPYPGGYLSRREVNGAPWDVMNYERDLSFIVRMNEDFPPVITCNDITLYLDENGQASTTAGALADWSDDLGISQVIVSPVPNFNCNNLGENEVSITVTDTGGHTRSCTATVTIQDEIPPTLESPIPNMTFPTTLGECHRSVTFPDPGFSDNCQNGYWVEQIAGLPSGANFPVGTTTVTFRATDYSLNTTEHSFTVTITDTQGPEISIDIPEDHVVNVADGSCTATVFFNVQAIDNCDGPVSFEQTEGFISGSSFPQGVTTNTFIATDQKGNITEVSYTITVSPIPSLSCATAPITTQVGSMVTMDMIDNGSTTNCGGYIGMSAQKTAIELTEESPQDDLGGVYYVELNAFMVPTTGDYTIHTVGTSTSAFVLYEEYPVPNSGDFSDRPGYLGFCIFNLGGIATAGTETYTLEAGKVYYVQNINVDPFSSGTGTYTLSFDKEVILTDGYIQPNCEDAGTQDITLYGFNASGDVATCTASLVVDASTGCPPDLSCIGSYDAALINNYETEIDPYDLVDTLSDGSGIAYPMLEGNKFLVDTQGGNTDRLTGTALFPFDKVVIRPPVDGTYTFSFGTNFLPNGVDASFVLWDAPTLANSGYFSLRPEYVGHAFYSNGELTEGNPSIALSAGQVYYISVFTPFFYQDGKHFNGHLLVDQPLKSNKVLVAQYGCSDWGSTLPITLYANDEDNEESSCMVDVTIVNPNGSCRITLRPKVYLQGAALNPNASEATLMRDDLRVNDHIPLTSPYGDGKTVDASILTTTGSDAIVDWVWVELRDKNDNKLMVDGTSALLQRDGDVVGVSYEDDPVVFTQADDDYFVVIDHRNHLAIMSSFAIPLSVSTATIDFANGNVTAYGTSAMTSEGMPTGIQGMWAGDTNNDGKVIFLNTGAESVDIKQLVLAQSAVESPFGASVFYKAQGYHNTDINMDGQVIFLNDANDLIPIKENVLAHPGNQIFNSVFFTFAAQLP